MLIIQFDDPINKKKINQALSSEHLELDLISTSSINQIETENNINYINFDNNKNVTNINFINDNNIEKNSLMSYQETDTAFLNLARCLEEHAKLFFAAENIALSRTIKQRNALLDALINALKSYQYNNEIFNNSDVENSFIEFNADNESLNSSPKKESFVNNLIKRRNSLAEGKKQLQKSISFISNKILKKEM